MKPWYERKYMNDIYTKQKIPVELTRISFMFSFRSLFKMICHFNISQSEYNSYPRAILPDLPGSRGLSWLTFTMCKFLELIVKDYWTFSLVLHQRFQPIIHLPATIMLYLPYTIHYVSTIYHIQNTNHTEKLGVDGQSVIAKFFLF